MATEEKKKKRTPTRKAVKSTVETQIDPFAEVVDAVEVKAADPRKPAPKKPRVKKALAEPVVVAADAFAEPAVESSPVKKRAVRKKKVETAVAETIEAKAVPKKRNTAVRKKAEPKAVSAVAVAEETAVVDATAEIARKEPEVELSPVFKALANVELPDLERENRAQLLMQSPTRLYFYWSIRENPWQRLRAIFGEDLGSYRLVLKLKDLKRDTEEIFPCDAEGNWWFNVEPDGEYEAELGFYAVNRPYFRILYSNSVTTPRRSPSPRPASDAKWTVSANKFAEVLDMSGFTRDAYDVALAGDDPVTADNATQIAFSQFVDTSEFALNGITAEDIRFAMIAIAAGRTLEELRWRVGPSLFAILQENAENLAAENARKALGEYFDIDESEWTEEEFSSAVYGASLVHFPKQLKKRKLSAKTSYSPRYNPVSSHSIGR
ncbi:MAG: DUF4912 domain-containing protein [Acidobacteriota bacterium]|nr:MAG: DUF4912 domain-containing protein [Acidobacteriota bacterium]